MTAESDLYFSPPKFNSQGESDVYAESYFKSRLRWRDSVDIKFSLLVSEYILFSLLRLLHFLYLKSLYSILFYCYISNSRLSLDYRHMSTAE